MNSPTLIIACDDWFPRQLYWDAAEESKAFSSVVAVDDGYSALAETWDRVEHSKSTDCYIVDMRTCHLNGMRLITELRADPVTQKSFIAVLCDNPAAGEYGADICTGLEHTSTKLVDLMRLIASCWSTGAHK